MTKSSQRNILNSLIFLVQILVPVGMTKSTQRNILNFLILLVQILVPLGNDLINSTKHIEFSHSPSPNTGSSW